MLRCSLLPVAVAATCFSFTHLQVGEGVRLGTTRVKLKGCHINSELEDQLVRVLEKNTELTIQNTDLQKQVQRLQNVKGENGPRKVNKLESILKQMREATDKRKELEHEHSEALTQLKEKQIEAQRKLGSTSDKAKAYENIETLQSKIRELEKKTELQNVRHEELMLEMAAIKRSAQNKSERSTSSNSSAAWKKSGLHQEVQTSPDSRPSTPELNCVDRSTPVTSNAIDTFLDQQRMPSTAKHRGNAGFHQFGGIPYSMPTGNVVSFVDASFHPSNIPLDPQFFLPGNNNQLWSAALPYWVPPEGPLRMCLGAVGGDGLGVSASPVAVSSSGGSSSGSGPHSIQPPTNVTSEIDRIMAKIDQDNRILAELDKTRSTIGVSVGGGRLLPPNPPIWTSSSNQLTVPVRTGLPSSGVVQDTLSRHGMSGSMQADPSSFVVSTIGLPMMPQLQPQQMSIMSHSQVVNPLNAPYQFLLNSGAPSQPLLPSQPVLVAHHQGRLMPQIPTIVTSQFELDNRNNYLNGNIPSGVYNTFQDHHGQSGHDNKLVDMLDIPGKGRCYVYIARYSYDPFQQSPNECPEAELAINAGDYLLVWGNMDEDGFFDGELLDGRRGLVPSNFIQKLVGDDLLEFHQSVVQGLRDCDDSASTNIPQDLDYHQLNTEEYSKRFGAELELGDAFDDDEEEAAHSGEGPVPAPKQLTLERQLNKSVLIGWNPPDASSSPPIDCYHVYVDGVLKVTVKAIERTRALVEGVDSTRPHRISVRSVTANRRTSRDAACTMVIGKDITLGPSGVKASRVTATSAVISWLPSNSNYQHTVCVNNVELRTVKPGVYRHTITGLAPNTIYRVTVRAKNIRAPHFDEKSSIPEERYSCHIDFRTLPKATGASGTYLNNLNHNQPDEQGLPEPPVDIQVEPGPQDGTLLVTWQPATPTSSNSGVLVTGYAVYADGKKVTDVDSPTGDHALIDINKLLSLNPKQVTVRTKSRDNQSSDSVPTPIPANILKGKQHSNKDEERSRMRYGSSVPAHMRHHHRSGQVVIETEENLSDKEIYPSNNMSIPAIEITKDTGSEGNFSEDDYIDGVVRRSGGGARSHHPPHYESQHRQQRQYGPRPPPPPSQHHSQSRPGPRRDERDPYYISDRSEPRRHGERGGGRGGGSSGGGGGGIGYRGSGGAVAGGGPVVRGPPPSQQQSGPPRDKRVRWFVALFDYDPTTMSPNPDACEEELPFSEGDSIKVIGEKDADGFYWGECRGKCGFVPHNMVVEVQPGVEGGPNTRETNRGRDRWGDIYANMPVKKMIALYDYDPQELSPNVDAEVELSFNTGNIIYVYGDMDDDGFYMGELDGVRGLVPSNFLTEAPPDFSNGSGPPMRGPRGPGRPAPVDRGHGPGARGPPPPPREGMPPRTDPRDRRKDACPVPTQVAHRQDGRGEAFRSTQPENRPQRESEPRHPPPTKKYQAPLNPQLQADKPAPLVSQVVPEPQAPNLMQKLTEMTGGDNSVDHILSKGKELIFMKFGLGK